MIRVFIIDNDGFIEKDALLEDDYELSDNMITIALPNDYKRARWNQSKSNWEEGATEEWIKQYFSPSAPISDLDKAKQENAQLAYELMITQDNLNQMTLNQADLTYQLMVKGVL